MSRTAWQWVFGVWFFLLPVLLVWAIWLGLKILAAVRANGQDVKLVKQLLIVWSQMWGQAPDAVQLALRHCIDELSRKSKGD